MLKWLWLSALIVVVDQATKWLAVQYLQLHVPHALLPVLNLNLSYNEGAAFSFLGNAGGWQRWLFIGLALVVSVVLLAWLRRLTRGERLLAVALSLVLGGAIGNVIDRIWQGRVTDFIQLHYADWYFPTFNVADMAISLGVVLLLIDGLFGGRGSKHP